MVSYKTLISYILYTCIVFALGYKTHVVWEGYKLSQYQKIENVVKGNLSEMQASNAKNYEDIKKLLEDRKVEVIEKEVTKIITKPIYKQAAIDQEGVDALKKYREDSKKLIGGVK